MEIVPVQPNKIEGLFTCNTCGLAFPTADLQRLHMKTDWHRYNLKRKVAQLPPITAEMFADKMLQQEAEQKQAAADQNGRRNGTRQVTKKDKKREERLQRRMEQQASAPPPRPASPGAESMVSSTFSLGDPDSDSDGSRSRSASASFSRGSSQSRPDFGGDSVVEDGESEVDNSQDIIMQGLTVEQQEEEKEIRRRLKQAVYFGPSTCFIDDTKFDTVEQNVDYLFSRYGLFLPEKEFLVDLPGLIDYLGEKVGVGNICLYCGFQGRSLGSVRDHMISKQHVKIPYDTLDDKLEISDFYDFTSSYGKDEWEDEDDNGEIVEGGDSDLSDEEPVEGLYVDSTGTELELASGQRIGHRSLSRYYRQNFRPSSQREGENTVVAVDARTSSLVTVRDKAEDKAVKQVWKDQKKQRNVHFRRDKYINNQPHFRDELLQ